MTARLLIVTGAGGVGKTTISATLGAAAAYAGERVLVITVDPARRLADAFGLTPARTNDPVEVALPIGGKGSLSVAMIDARHAWDMLVTQLAPDETTRQRVLNNRLYDTVTERFALSHDYVAFARVIELADDATYDLVVVDTAPATNALDSFDSPRRMREFFGSRLARWLVVPAGAAKPFALLAGRLLGGSFIADLAEFFTLVGGLETGLREHSEDVECMLGSPRCQLIIVSTPEAGPVSQSLALRAHLDARQMNLRAIVVNRALPPELLDPAFTQTAVAMTDDTDPVIREVGRAGLLLRDRARLQHDHVALLPEPKACVQLRAGGVSGLDDLWEMGQPLLGLCTRFEGS